MVPRVLNFGSARLKKFSWGELAFLGGTMNNIFEIDKQIKAMAGRIAALREIEGYSAEYMAEQTGISVAEYLDCEAGRADLTFAFLFRCASALGIDVTEIIEGTAPRLKSYTLTRKGRGQRIEQAHGMTYYNIAHSFANRTSNPLYVHCEYSEKAESSPIAVTTHAGQECDIVIKGRLKVQVGEHTEILEEGDSIYYDSSTPHGMIAIGGEDCYFYAIVLLPDGNQDENKIVTLEATPAKKRDTETRVYSKFITTEEDENGAPISINFKGENSFNFAYDIVDTLGRSKPDKLAIMHVAEDGAESRITFSQVKRASAQCANYFKSLGIKRGDRVMLVLKRRYQFWYAMIGLHKLGAVAIPATNQLKEHDYEYRFNAAGVKAIICVDDDYVIEQAEAALAKCPDVSIKLLVGSEREGWRNFNEEYTLFSSHFERTDDSPCGDDPMLMYFTSGTSGYPKIALHNYKYPLGHFHTAKYWHCVNPDGLHLTISDTGWAKAMWGKLYGAWLCEAAIFVYDFDRFDASKILPLFRKYNITTFCAPPTMYRMIIKEDLSKYDLSSIEHATIAGEALNPEVFRQFEKQTGLKIMEGFGQSETTLVIGNLVGKSHKIGSMGKPVPIYNVDLVDPDGNSVGIGDPGEIVIHTENGVPCGLFCEYYNTPEKTAEVWHDGVYHTGDLAWRDEDGFFWYVGRADDVIKSSGYRIGPFEIESVIMELPYVLECGVSAAPDEIRGQIVKASIVLTKGTEPTEELKKDIQNYVKKRTAPYKYPRLVEFKSELPKTTSGKIIRSKL